MIRIVPPPRGAPGIQTRVEDESGNLVPGVLSTVVHIEPGSHVLAELTIRTDVGEIWATPMLSIETLRASAAYHGYQLVKIGD